VRLNWFFNPVAATEVRALLRGRKWVYGTIVFAVLGAAGVLNAVIAAPDSGAGWVAWLPGPLFLFAELVAPVATVARIQARRAQRTLDELLTTRIRPQQILGGLVTPGWVMAARPLLLGAVFFAGSPQSQWGISGGATLPWHVYLVDAVSIAGTAFAWSLFGAAFGARHKNLGAAVVRLLIFILVAKVLFISCWLFVAAVGSGAGSNALASSAAGWNLERFTQERSAGFAFGYGWDVLLWAQWGVMWGMDEPGALLWTALVVAFGVWQFRRAARQLGRQPS